MLPGASPSPLEAKYSHGACRARAWRTDDVQCPPFGSNQGAEWRVGHHSDDYWDRVAPVPKTTITVTNTLGPSRLWVELKPPAIERFEYPVSPPLSPCYFWECNLFHLCVKARYRMQLEQTALSLPLPLSPSLLLPLSFSPSLSTLEGGPRAVPSGFYHSPDPSSRLDSSW